MGNGPTKLLGCQLQGRDGGRQISIELAGAGVDTAETCGEDERVGLKHRQKASNHAHDFSDAIQHAGVGVSGEDPPNVAQLLPDQILAIRHHSALALTARHRGRARPRRCADPKRTQSLVRHHPRKTPKGAWRRRLWRTGAGLRSSWVFAFLCVLSYGAGMEILKFQKRRPRPLVMRFVWTGVDP
eukprot:scaffold1019_cov255-Pinguiococcus_pyrenoidosus.AAC.21